MNRMYYRNTKSFVDVYDIDVVSGKAFVFDPNLSVKNSGNGWKIIQANRLIPAEYVDLNGNYLSKTEKNKIKERLIISSIELTCTDGSVFTDWDSAIEHERNLVKEN